MKHLGLFAGIGGFELAARWMGWETVAWCEWNEFCQKVLKYHFPEAQGHSDITKTDFTKYKNAIDIITGGFPCQPYSTSGKRRGKNDDRHLWPEMLRAIREIQPAWIVGENVRGLVNWSGGLVFEEVQTDLEAEGYEVLPVLLPAAGVGAPHERYRIWFIAHSSSNVNNKQAAIGGDRCEADKSESQQKEWEWLRDGFNRINETGVTSYSIGRQQPLRTHDQRMGRQREQDQETRWQQFPTQHPVCSGNDGLSGQLDGITFSDWRKATMRGYGNAIVPKLTLQIFKTIEQYNFNTF